MAVRQIDPELIYRQLEHLEKEIQVIKQELAQIGSIPESLRAGEAKADAAWEALQEAKGLWEREWDAEWESVWNRP